MMTGFPSEYQRIKAIMSEVPQEIAVEAEVVAAIPEALKPTDGIKEARKHLMQCANLMLICMESARYVAKEWEKRHEHTQIPNEHFQGLCQTFFIEARGMRYVDRMPNQPLKPKGE